MIICQECFADEILKSEINIAQKKGKCNICTNDDFVYDTEKDDYLKKFFNQFIDIFSSVDQIKDFPTEEGTLLKTEIAKNWSIFTTKDESVIYKVLREICKDIYEKKPYLFDSVVGVDKLYDPQYLKDHSLLVNNNWEDFVNDIKYNNRFHTNHINKELLEKYCSAIFKTYDKGATFYRCRISPNNKGFEQDEIGPPPKDKATDGRVNSKGVSRLYLGDSEKTTIYETRAGLYDYISIGKFCLKESITVVDFKRINKISPFQEGIIDDISELAINKQNLEKINTEMGRVMRRTDNVLDYLPTQYIADFVRSIVPKDAPDKLAYDGIEFRSVMNPDGYNLAIFNSNPFEITNVETKKIDHISYG